MLNANWSAHREMLRIAIPMILSNITVPLLSLVDTAVVGHLSHAYYLGGVAVGSMIVTFIFWFCGFLRMSTTGATAQAFGANEPIAQVKVLLQGGFVAVLIAAIVLLLHPFILSFGLSLSGGSAEVMLYASQYFSVRVWSAPAVLLNLVLLGWMLGMHDAKGPMWQLILANALNIVLDIWFVWGLDLGVKGVAAATVIADYCALAFGLFWVWRLMLREKLHIPLKQVKQLIKEELLAFVNVNKDILLRTLMLEICFAFITFQGARLGDTYVATNAVLLNFLLFISFGLDGIAYSAEALVGKAKGAQRMNELQRAVSLGLGWSLLLACGYSLLFWLGGEQIIGIITDIDAIRVLANEHLVWIIALPLVSVWCFLFDGVFIGLTRGKDMRNSMFVSVIFGFFGVWYLAQGLGNHGLWLALLCLMLFRGISLGWRYYRLVNNGHVLT